MRYHRLMATLYAFAFDHTGGDWACRGYLNHSGWIAAERLIVEAEKIQARNQRIADALHEMGIYHR